MFDTSNMKHEKDLIRLSGDGYDEHDGDIPNQVPSDPEKLIPDDLPPSDLETNNEEPKWNKSILIPLWIFRWIMLLELLYCIYVCHRSVIQSSAHL